MVCGSLCSILQKINSPPLLLLSSDPQLGNGGDTGPPPPYVGKVGDVLHRAGQQGRDQVQQEGGVRVRVLVRHFEFTGV